MTKHLRTWKETRHMRATANGVLGGHNRCRLCPSALQTARSVLQINKDDEVDYVVLSTA